MFDENMQYAIADFAVNIEIHGGAVAANSAASFDYQNLDENGKRELAANISSILIGFLCAAEEVKTKIYILGSTGGILGDELLDDFAEREVTSGKRISPVSLLVFCPLIAISCM